MRNRNTLSVGNYLVDHVIYLIMIAICYNATLYAPLGTLTAKVGTLVMLLIVALVSAIGILLTIRKRRNYLSVFVNLAWAFGFYYLLSKGMIVYRGVIWTLVVAFLAVAAYIGWVLWEYFREPAQTVALWECVKAALLSSRTIAAVVFGVVLTWTLISGLAGFAPMTGHNETEVKPGEALTMDQCMEQVLLLQEDVWADLDMQQRLDVMKVVADLEASAMGIPTVTVQVDALEGRTLGHYRHSDRTVALDAEYLSKATALQMIHVIGHEMRHGYQHLLAEAYESAEDQYKSLELFREPSIYRYEFDHYIDGYENYEGYDSQACERDADAYGAKCALKYTKAIQSYLKEQTEN